MADYQAVTGSFLCKRDQQLYTYTHFLDRIEQSSRPYAGLPALLEDSHYPLWLLRHAFGEDLGNEDHRTRPVEDHLSEDRQKGVKGCTVEGRLRDLSYRGLSVPVSVHGYSHAVGPIHAGIIEPGHFRFSLEGETIQSLDIRLGFQHRGIVSSLCGRGPAQAIPLFEAVSADSTIAYACAAAGIYETAFHLAPPADVLRFRACLLELERIAIHIGDLGAVAADIGYYPLAGLCSLDRGIALSVMEALTGSRFGRGSVWPGELRLPRDIDKPNLAELAYTLERSYGRIEAQYLRAVDNSTFRERLQHCGVVHRRRALQNGFVGMTARSCGIEMDLRRSDPIYEAKPKLNLQIPFDEMQGDALSRFSLRFFELRQSVAWVCALLRQGPWPPRERGPLRVQGQRPPQPGVFFHAVEGWRGSVLIALDLDAEGKIVQAYVRDPSVLNWHALELAARGALIGDFPLNNKSFNLSYAGVDL